MNTPPPTETDAVVWLLVALAIGVVVTLIAGGMYMVMTRLTEAM